MIDHVELFVGDGARAVAFYRGALAPLGYTLAVTGDSSGFGTPDGRLDFWLRPGGPSAPRRAPPARLHRCSAGGSAPPGPPPRRP